VGDGADQMDDSFLPGDPPDEQDERSGRIHTPAAQGVHRRRTAVLVQIDPVVNDMHTFRLDLEMAQHIRTCLPRDCDDGVRRFHGGALHPAAEAVSGAQLLFLPWTERFQRVHRQHMGDGPQFLGPEAGHGRVPCVGVDDARVQPVLGHAQAAVQGVQRTLESDVGVLAGFGPHSVPADSEIGAVHRLVAKTPDQHRDKAGQFPAQVLHVNAGAAVHIGRVFLGEDGDSTRVWQGVAPKPFRGLRFLQYNASYWFFRPAARPSPVTATPARRCSWPARYRRTPVPASRTSG